MRFTKITLVCLAAIAAFLFVGSLLAQDSGVVVPAEARAKALAIYERLITIGKLNEGLFAVVAHDEGVAWTDNEVAEFRRIAEAGYLSLDEVFDLHSAFDTQERAAASDSWKTDVLGGLLIGWLDVDFPLSRIYDPTADPRTLVVGDVAKADGAVITATATMRLYFLHLAGDAASLEATRAAAIAAADEFLVPSWDYGMTSEERAAAMGAALSKALAKVTQNEMAVAVEVAKETIWDSLTETIRARVLNALRLNNPEMADALEAWIAERDGV